ncbi:uncharacterized protein LOC105286028 isoform X3 [Ooceraea biroi]|uniref:uncharacterized protein LOC105286028 isoform X3 n=1 Tax=Ooceraea biroi TaxID=2015173 RepID=UPI000F084E58|nr:uncharacterized protein LOC105286028 isoform X3 [Ooceraea biroi]
MVFAGARCFKLHRIMFMIVGLWPYQKTVIWQIQAVFFFGAYSCMLFSQFTPFLTTTCNMDCILKRFSIICITFVFILIYYSFYFNSEAVKQMVEHMHFDWKMFANSDAMKIFEEYLFESYIFAVSLCLLELSGLGIGTWSLLTTGTFLTTVTKHSCATYKIVSYLIHNTVTVHTLQLPIVQRIQYMRRNICLSVYFHRRTMEFCKDIIPSFNMWYFPVVFIGVLSLSCVLFRLYNAIMQFNDLYDILVCNGVLVCYLLYMFMANFLAQSYTDHSVEVLESAYDTLWYVAPLPIQKLFLIMQNSIRSHKIVVGGLFVASIEGFSTLVTSAVSYFTVMHAMRL